MEKLQSKNQGATRPVETHNKQSIGLIGTMLLTSILSGVIQLSLNSNLGGS